MKTSLKAAFFIFTFIFFSQYSFAAKYYFSTYSGDDSRTAAQAQNSSTPWKSIAKLNSIIRSLKPGDEILFKRGEVFYGSINITASGAQGRPIKFGAYGSGAKPIITSLVTLKDWKSIGNGVYESSDPSLARGVNMVLINETMQEMGRYPNSDADNKGYLTYESASWNSISDSDLSSSTNWSGGEVVIRKNFWVIDRHKISWQSGRTISYNNFPVAQFSPSAGYGYFIQDHPNTLDKFGEWHFNKNTKKLRVHFGQSSPSSHKVAVGTQDYLVHNSSSNVRYVTFENLHFKGSNKGAFLLGKNGTDVTIVNCEIEYSGINAVEIEGISNFTLEKTNIVHSNNNALFIKSSKNATVRDNLIKNTYLFPGHGENGNNNGVAIRTDSDDILIEYNEIINTGYSGIKFDGSNVTIKNNLIDRFCLTTNDGGGIYTYSSRSANNKNRKIIGNIILNGEGVKEGAKMFTMLSKPQAEGIYLDDNASDVEVVGNTVAHMTSKGIYLHNASNIRVRNNTIYDNKHQLFLRNDHMGKPLQNNTVENNFFLSKDALQNHVQIMTIYSDIKKLANYNNNYYATPLIDDIRINAVKNTGSSSESSLLFNLKSWQKTFDKDWTSKTIGKLQNVFSVKQQVGSNKYDNGKFDKSLGYVGCANCTSSLDNKGGMDGNALKIKSSGMSRTSFQLRSLKKGKQYVLKFSAKSNKEIGLSTFLRQEKDPWETVTETRNFALTTNRQNFETVFTALADVDEFRLMMNINQEENVEFYLDNLELYEAVVDVIDPDDAILFEYNASRNPKKINLYGEYVDMKNVRHTSSVTIEPYSSVLLIKKSNKMVEVAEEQAASVTVASPKTDASFTMGADIPVSAEVNAPAGSITKVEFYHGDKLIGSADKAPYNIVWKNAPAGNYTILAKARVKNESTVESSPVPIKVSGAKGDQVNTDKNGNLPIDKAFKPIFLNTGTTIDVDHRGDKFIGDSKNSSYYQNSYIYSNVRAIDDKLYQTERNGENLKYSIPVPNGTYTVKTFHYELWFGNHGPSAQAGRRVFDIIMEGKVLKKDFDIYVENKNRPTELTFSNIQVTDGKLNLDLIASRDRASISGIAIYKNSSSEASKMANSTSASVFYNTGSSASAKYQGHTFKADQKSFYSSSTANTNARASNEALFQSERYGRDLTYSIPVPNGVYTVQTYHNELWFGTYGPSEQAGRRVFDISVEGDVKKRDFDLYKENRNNPTVLTFRDIVVNDGILNIDMSASINNATISGIGIIPQNEKSIATSANLRIAEDEIEVVEDEIVAAEEEDASPSMMDSEAFEIKAYPNPATDVVNLSVGKDIGEFDILLHNTNGQLVEHLDAQMMLAGDGRYLIPVSHLQKGVYLLTIVNKKEIVKRLRLIISS